MSTCEPCVGGEKILGIPLQQLLEASDPSKVNFNPGCNFEVYTVHCDNLLFRIPSNLQGRDLTIDKIKIYQKDEESSVSTSDCSSELKTIHFDYNKKDKEVEKKEKVFTKPTSELIEESTVEIKHKEIRQDIKQEKEQVEAPKKPVFSKMVRRVKNYTPMDQDSSIISNNNFKDKAEDKIVKKTAQKNFSDFSSSDDFERPKTIRNITTTSVEKNKLKSAKNFIVPQKYVDDTLSDIMTLKNNLLEKSKKQSFKNKK